MEWNVRRVVETESTNADLAEAARDGAPEGTVIVAGHQTAGRGRLDRTWDAPPGSGLTMSALVRPVDLAPERWPWIPLAAGVAVADALSGLGLMPQLKWPNDVLLDGAKVAGLLVERVETSIGPAAVVGLGLNVAMTAEQLPVQDATSLALHGVEADRDEVLERVLASLARTYDHVFFDVEALRSSYVSACHTVGTYVTVSLPGGSDLSGTATDIDTFGRLIVDGNPVTAGDVIHVRA
ncbi:MAG TPA: biotin--[acetyl-CoA-carboxylase] ligase [Aeromicrobium sp.]|nr:biotin--[acetyl-CoA-carboxylase] ligase [Aeromicrobium sp.]